MSDAPTMHIQLLFSLNLLLVLIKSLAADEKVCTDPELCTTQKDKLQSRKQSVYEPQCVYYLAPSSIPNSGFGTYTVRDIATNTLLMQQADAPTIVLSETRNHNERNTERNNWDVEPLSVHKNYFWDGTGIIDFEVDGAVEESVTTFGALANYHPYLFNLHPTVEEPDDSITPRASQSPGIGIIFAINYVSLSTFDKQF